MELIDKAAIVALLREKAKESRKNATIAHDNNNIPVAAVWSGKENLCRELLELLDTLEVKEVDLENSMVCKVDWYDGFLLDYTQEQQDELLEKIGANVGDKIRVILIKE